MRYVLDSCVAMKWFLAEPDSARAVQLLDEFAGQIHQLSAPDVFSVEIAHALSRGAPGFASPARGFATSVGSPRVPADVARIPHNLTSGKGQSGLT